MNAFDITIINGINFTEISHLAAELDGINFTEISHLAAELDSGAVTGLLGDVPSYVLDELAEMMSEDDGGYQVTLDDLLRWHDEDNGSERVAIS